MRPADRTVYVTGVGAVTPLGRDAGTTWQALLDGRSGARRLDELWARDLPVRIACRAEVDAVAELGRPLARKTDRSAHFALMAAREAWRDAGSPAVRPARLGVVVSSGVGGVTSVLDAYDTLNSRGPRRVSPHTVPMFMPNGAAAHVGIELGARAGVHILHPHAPRRLVDDGAGNPGTAEGLGDRR